MAGKIKEIGSMPLSGTENGKIEIAIIEEPYGKESEKVASIGIFLNADANEPDWKVHLPKTDIEGVIISLKKAMELL